MFLTKIIYLYKTQNITIKTNNISFFIDGEFLKNAVIKMDAGTEINAKKLSKFAVNILEIEIKEMNRNKVKIIFITRKVEASVPLRFWIEVMNPKTEGVKMSKSKPIVFQFKVGNEKLTSNT
jgi:hypothetical protein